MIEVAGCDSREKAGKFVGAGVFWLSSGKEKKVI
ncbi:unnamed protein product, partial [marine sediment metagenome]